MNEAHMLFFFGTAVGDITEFHELQTCPKCQTLFKTQCLKSNYYSLHQERNKKVLVFSEKLPGIKYSERNGS